jgi:tetratricopeptide (TPR) repeat protein
VRKLLFAIGLVLAGSMVCLFAEDTNNPHSYSDRTFTPVQNTSLDNIVAYYDQLVDREPTNTVAIYNLAVVRHAKGDFHASLALMNRYIQLCETNNSAYALRGRCFNLIGKPDEAIKDFNEALKLNPKDSYSLANRGFAFCCKGEYENAVGDFKLAMDVDGNNDEAYNNLAWLRATCPLDPMRDGKEAVSLATKACELSHWARWTRIDTLAAAYAEDGNFTKAIEFGKMALQMSGTNEKDRKEMEMHLSHFQKNLPFHESHNH